LIGNPAESVSAVFAFLSVIPEGNLLLPSERPEKKIPFGNDRPEKQLPTPNPPL
jgi:hypothetical protein